MKPVQFQVDFNAIRDGCVIGLQRRATGTTDSVDVRSVVQTFDLDGNTCWAEVVAKDDGRFTLRLLMQTFGCQPQVESEWTVPIAAPLAAATFGREAEAELVGA